MTRLDFLVDQEGAGLAVGGVLDGAPQLQQVVQVPLQFFVATADAGGAGDDAHAVRHVELVDMASRSSLRSSPSTRRETPPPRGLLGISTR